MHALPCSSRLRFGLRFGLTLGRKMGLTLLLALVVSGCAVYPAVQVAGGAMTGYDAVVLADEYLPKDGVAGGELNCNTDRMLERRLRERLRLNGMTTVTAHVIDRHAYLVGQVAEQSRARHAVQTAKTIQGLRLITIKLYPPTTPREAQHDTHTLARIRHGLAASKRFEESDLRVEVIRGHAILIGRTPDYSRKSAAMAIASEVGGVTQVVDYITVPAPKGALEPEERVALR